MPSQRTTEDNLIFGAIVIVELRNSHIGGDFKTPALLSFIHYSITIGSIPREKYEILI